MARGFHFPGRKCCRVALTLNCARAYLRLRLSMSSDIRLTSSHCYMQRHNVTSVCRGYKAKDSRTGKVACARIRSQPRVLYYPSMIPVYSNGSGSGHGPPAEWG